MPTQWNDSEEEALHGLPWIAQLVYLRALRPHMDYASGVVGIKRGISLKGLSETLHVEPGQGRKDSGDPSQKAVRHALELLVRQGLIETMPATMKLIFRLPLASTDDSVSEKWGTFGARLGHRKLGTDEPSNDGAESEKQGTFGADPNHEKWGTPPVSGIRKEDSSPLPPSRDKPEWSPPPWINTKAWEEFEQHRREIKKPLSDMARTKAANQLRELTQEQQQACIDISIQSRWAGLFPGKVNGHETGKPTRQNSAAQRGEQFGSECWDRINGRGVGG